MIDLASNHTIILSKVYQNWEITVPYKVMVHKFLTCLKHLQVNEYYSAPSIMTTLILHPYRLI